MPITRPSACLNGTRDVQVYNCTFTNITNGGHAAHDLCPARYCGRRGVKLRLPGLPGETMCVSGTIPNIAWSRIAHLSAPRARAAWPFVSAELYNETNSDSAGDEFFGTYFQVSSNSFIYKASGGPGPYSALHFSDTGWSPDTYYCDLTSAQASPVEQRQHELSTVIPANEHGHHRLRHQNVRQHLLRGRPIKWTIQYVWDGTSPYDTGQGTIGLNNVPDASGAPMATVAGDAQRQFRPAGISGRADFSRRR